MSLIEEAEKHLQQCAPHIAKRESAQLIKRLVEALKKKESHTMLGEKDTRRAEDYKDE